MSKFDRPMLSVMDQNVIRSLRDRGFTVIICHPDAAEPIFAGDKALALAPTTTPEQVPA